MPAGVTWGVYLRYTAAALLSMMAGSQVVHMYYRPMDDLPSLVEAEKLRLLKENAQSGSSTIISEKSTMEDATDKKS